MLAIFLLRRAGRFLLVAGTLGYFALSSDVRLRNLAGHHRGGTLLTIFIVNRRLGSLPILLRTSFGAAIGFPKMVGPFANTVLALSVFPVSSRT